MKRVLILTIALLFIAGLAFSELTIKGEFKYRFMVANNPTAGTIVNHGMDELKLDLAASTESMKGAIQIMVNKDVTVAASYLPGVRVIFVTTNILNALAVKEVPLSLKLNALTGLGEIKASQPWSISHHGLENEGAMGQKLLANTFGWAFQIGLLDMITITGGQETDSTSWKNGLITTSTGGYKWAMARTMLDILAKIEFVQVSASAIIQNANVGRTSIAFQAGALADLSSFVGVTLKVSASIGNLDLLADNTAATAPFDGAYYWGGAVRVEVPFGDMSLKASVSANGRGKDQYSLPIRGVGVAAEFWLTKQFGIGTATVLAFESSSATPQSGISSLIANAEIFLLANLGATTVHVGYVWIPDAAGVGEMPSGTSYRPYGTDKLEFGAENNNSSYGGFALLVYTKL